MGLKLILGFLLIVMIACNRNAPLKENQSTLAFDTLVGHKIFTNEIGGSVYRKRATSYFLVIKSDTSDFVCIFSESKGSGKVAMDLNIPYLKASMTYGKRIKELKMILPKAANDYDFDSLTLITFGRLILSGDLAVDVTKQYEQVFGSTDKVWVKNYKAFEDFLLKSKLATDLDKLLRPYSASVNKVYIEKVFFTTKEDLYWASKIETDSTDIPEKILDCLTWVQVTNR